MKKIIALLMVFTLMFSVCACGKNNDDSNTSKDASSASSESETSKEEATPTDDETDNETDTQSSACMEEGETGDGPADLNAGLVTFTVPEGYSYEAYTIYIDEEDPLFGNITVDIMETGSYGMPIRIEASTQNFVSSQDEAVQKSIELYNLPTYEEGTSSIGESVAYGENTFTQVDFSTEYGAETFFVAYAENGNDDEAGLHIVVKVDTAEIAADDPVVKEILESIAVVTK